MPESPIELEPRPDRLPLRVIQAVSAPPGRTDRAALARRVAAFLGEARRSLDLALYDVRLPGEPGDVVSAALREAAARGVAVRIAYNADHDERVFPPPPRTEPELIEALPFPTCGIPGIPDLMHHKYVVRDGEAVWTGPTNWTTDSWTLQENVIVVIDSPEVAAEYARNFEELWSARDVTGPGARSRARSTSTVARRAPGSRPGTARSCRTGSRARSGGARADPDRLAGADRRAGDRHARGGRRRGARGPARRG